MTISIIRSVIIGASQASAATFRSRSSRSMSIPSEAMMWQGAESGELGAHCIPSQRSF